MKHILLVEDDPFIRDIVSTKLKDAAYDVATAGTADEAYENLEGQVPDLILLDIDLPGGQNGIEILKQLRAGTTHDNIPVIIFSNNDAPDIREQAKAAGAQDFYFKASTGSDELLSKIASLLG